MLTYSINGTCKVNKHLSAAFLNQWIFLKKGKGLEPETVPSILYVRVKCIQFPLYQPVLHVFSNEGPVIIIAIILSTEVAFYIFKVSYNKH